jgi:hypothetical protein
LISIQRIVRLSSERPPHPPTLAFALIPQPATAQTNLNPDAAELAAAIDIPAASIVLADLVQSPDMTARAVGGVCWIRGRPARGREYDRVVFGDSTAAGNGGLRDGSGLERGAVLAVVESPTVGVANVAFDSMANPVTMNTAFVNYAWAWTGGSASGPAPTVILPLGIHVVTLTATDPDGGSASDTVTISVLDGTPSLGDAITALGASVAAHDTSIAALQASITALQSTIATLQATIAALESSLTAQGTRIEGAESRAAALEAQVLTLQNALQGLLDHPIWNSVPNAGPKR